MEETYILLSKLVQTKSIERVLAPIASQVSQLVIVNAAFEDGDTDAFPADLLPCAELVMRSTEGLVEAAQKLAQQSVDPILQSDMPGACETLSVAGTNLLTAAQRVQMENFSSFARRNLIRSAKDVFEGTLKVLLVSDDSEIIKIKNAIKCTRERLGILMAVKTIKNLVAGFKGFTESIMVLTTLVDKRQLDLSQPKHREVILLSLTTLKKCVPMLNSSMQTYVKYPGNDQANASKLYVVGQILECLENLEAAVQSKDSVTEDIDEPETPGHFVTNIDRVMDLLCEERRLQLAEYGSELDMVVEALVRHSMAVSHLSQGQHRRNIIRAAQTLLKKRSEICKMSQMVLGNPTMHQLHADFNASCEGLIEDAQSLERFVNGAVLQLVVDVFKETREPLDRLMKALLTEHDDCLNVDGFIDDFHDHCDKMGQVARFTAATSLDAQKVRMINNCLSVLERVDPELMPALTACQNHHDDQAAIEHLRLLKDEWISALELLVGVIDDLIDGKTFIEVSEAETRRDALRCKQSLYSEERVIADVTRSMIGRARRVSHRASKLVDSHTDVMYRNGVMAYVKQLNKAIPALKAAANSVLEHKEDQSVHETFHKRCDIVLKCTTKVKDTVLGKLSPHLLDPVRVNARRQDQIASDNTLNKKSDVKESSKQSKKVAARSYVADISHNHIAAIGQRFISEAIGGRKQQLELMGNSILRISNHLSQIANSLVTHVQDSSRKCMLEEAVSAVIELVPQLLDKANKVADCDTSQIEPLHQTADSWAKQLSFLESRVDAVIMKWRSIGDRLVDAVNMCDKPHLTAQSDYIRDHLKSLQSLIGQVVTLSVELDVVSKEKATSLQRKVEGLQEQTNSMLSMAEKFTLKRPSDSDKLELNLIIREWTAEIFYLTSTVDGLAAQGVASLYRPLTVDRDDFTKLSPHIDDITRQTLQLKSFIETAIIGCTDKNRVSEGEKAMQDLDLAAAHVQESYDSLTGRSKPSHDARSMYVHQDFMMSLWSWACTVNKMRSVLYRWTSSCTGMMETFLQDISSLHHALTDEDRKAEEIRCQRFIVSIREILQKVRGRILDAIHNSDDIDGKNIMRRHLESWAELSGDLEKTSKALMEKDDRCNCDGFSMARLRWIIKCMEMDNCLHELPGVGIISVLEIIRLMQNSSGTKKWNSGSDVTLKTNALTSRNSTNSENVLAKSEKSPTYSQLASGPRSTHMTPIKPNETSGFRAAANKKTFTSSPLVQSLECDKWEDNNNAVVKVARELSQQLQDMTNFTKDLGPIKNKEQLISTARAVAKNGEKLVRFARVLVKYSIDKRVAEDLRCSADHMPTVIAQLNILASVKAAMGDDRSNEKMLLKTGANLLDCINRMLRNAEATCVKGLRQPDDSSIDETEAVIVATQWHRRLQRHRLMEYSTATVDQLGLRRVNEYGRAPELNSILKS